MNTQNYSDYLKYLPEVQGFFHELTNSISYVVADTDTKQCAIIDSVVDFDLPSGTLSYENVNIIANYVKEKGYAVMWHLETHMHADHLSAASYLKEKLGGKTAIGNHITEVQDLYKDVFGVSGAELAAARAEFDFLWKDYDTFLVGNIPAFTYYAPGHTPADIVYGIGNALFVGDSLFMPDFGSARCDFPGGSAEHMYESAQKTYAMPDDMRMFMCHDYLPENGRTEYKWETTVAEQKHMNKHLRPEISKERFIATREERDATLPLPKLMIPSLQVNVRAGKVPTENGKPMLRFPINSVFSKYPKITK